MNDITRQWKVYKSVCGSLEIFDRWANLGLISGLITQKNDTTRWYANISGEMSLCKLADPRRQYLSPPVPPWIYRLDVLLMRKIFRYTGINFIFRAWQKYCYRMAYKEVLTKYPEIYHTILHINVLDHKIMLAYFRHAKYDEVDSFMKKL